MPGSCRTGKEEIRDWIYDQPDIKTVVDVGAGSGTYPQLLGAERYKFIGIEIWEPYVEMFGLSRWYKRVIIGDVVALELPEGDCIIFGDVLEHLPKRDALKLIRRADKKYRHMVISIPLSDEKGVVRPARIHYGNPNEAHRSAWDFDDLAKICKWSFRKETETNHMGIFMK